MYDQTRADKAVGFIKLLKHTEDRWYGVPFQLHDWQEHEIIRPLFGEVTREGKRQYRKGYISVARKNGKTQLAAAIMLALMFLDKEAGGQYYSAAAEREQAAVIFKAMMSMILQNPALEKRCQIIESRKRIVLKDTGGVYVALSADAKNKHGLGPSVVIFDELHVQQKRDLFDALSTGSGARSQPLFLSLTTAGYDRNSICYEEYDYANKVLKGIVQDPTYLSVIYEAPEDAEWLSEDTWKLANPGLGVFRDLQEMRDFAAKAAQIPALQNTFRRLYLNQWTQQSNRALDMHLWDANAGMVIEEQLKGRTCYGALDLAAVSDLTAWVMVFPREDDPNELDILCRFWCPEARLIADNNRYRDQYQAWAKQGFLSVTPGDAVDYDYVEAQVLEDAHAFKLVDMNIDALFQGHQVASNLLNEGLQVFNMRQGFAGMTGPMTEFYRRLIAKKLHHGGNPVLRWMADNFVEKKGPMGMMPDKANAQGKIDGIVALIMAIDRAMRREESFAPEAFVI